jgi:small subunit ribosomal protein S1
MTGSNLGDMIRQKMEENAENGTETEAETEEE